MLNSTKDAMSLKNNYFRGKDGLRHFVIAPIIYSSVFLSPNILTDMRKTRHSITDAFVN